MSQECSACHGTGQKMEGDVVFGFCPKCGGSGSDDEIFDDESGEVIDDDPRIEEED